jgi:ankyrin repeat protein
MFNIKNKFFKALTEGDIEKVKSILNTNKKLLNTQDNCGWTPLHWSVSIGNIEMTKLFISMGAKINTKANMGESPLHLAHLLEVAELLISKGAEVNSKDNTGLTPLDLAMVEGNIELVEFLLTKSGLKQKGKIMPAEGTNAKWN